MHKNSLNFKLRVYFEKKMLYTIEKLSQLTGEEEKYVRVIISRMKNPKYANKKEERLDLVQDTGREDGIKRWGLRGVVKYADSEKFNKVVVKKITSKKTTPKNEEEQWKEVLGK